MTPEQKDKRKERQKQYYLKNKRRVNLRNAENNRRYYWQLKVQVMMKYSPEVRCAKCGFSDLRALSIDHIANGGRKHMESIGNSGGWHFHKWLLDNGCPPGFQVLCMNCQFIKQAEVNTVRVMQGKERVI